MKYAAIIKPDGEVDIVEFPNSQDDVLSFLQDSVGGYIEHLDIRCGGESLDLWLNEEGLLKGLPYNFIASDIVHTTWIELYTASDTAFIVGDVVVTSSDDMGDTLGLTEEQAKKVIDHIVNIGNRMAIDVTVE